MIYYTNDNLKNFSLRKRKSSGADISIKPGLDYPLHGITRSLTARAISKESFTPGWFVKEQQQQAQEEQRLEEELQYKYHRENAIISKIVTFGNELGYLPSLIELHRSGRFSRTDLELEAVRDALRWLTRGPIPTRYAKYLRIDGSDSSLCKIIQLTQQGDKIDLD